jgi:hypothetical protein
MDATAKNEIKKTALGYSLDLKITEVLTYTYLAPAYRQLREKHADLNFKDFMDEVVRIRRETRKLPFREAAIEIAHAGVPEEFLKRREEFRKRWNQ